MSKPKFSVLTNRVERVPDDVDAAALTPTSEYEALTQRVQHNLNWLAEHQVVVNYPALVNTSQAAALQLVLVRKGLITQEECDLEMARLQAQALDEYVQQQQVKALRPAATIYVPKLG